LEDEGGDGGGVVLAERAKALKVPRAAPTPAAPMGVLGPSALSTTLPLAEVSLVWDPYGPFRPELLLNMARLGYTAPTPIQRAVLPEAIRNFKDIVGTAATGSGKTAAYALPILHRLLDRREAAGMGTRGGSAAAAAAAAAAGSAGSGSVQQQTKYWEVLPALVLVPTRELAMQVRDHFMALSQGTAVRCVAVVGGLAGEKQGRLLRGHPDVVIATPGRLAELMTSGLHAPFLSMDLSTLQALVLDEADRMVEKGSFDWESVNAQTLWLRQKSRYGVTDDGETREERRR